MFHHVLEKRVKQHSSYVDYSRFRHCLWNILLLCWGCHDAYERNPAIKRLQSIVDYKQNLVDILEDGDYDYDKQHIWRSEEDIIEHALIQSLFGKHPLTYA